MRNKKNILLAIILIIAANIPIGCSQNNQDVISSPPSSSVGEEIQGGSKPSNIDSIADSEISIQNNGKKIVQKVTYKIEIPLDINAYNERDPEAEQIIFKRDGKTIGGVTDMLYGPGMSVSVVRPNNNKVLESKKVIGFQYEVWREKLEITQTTSKNTINEIHTYFLFGDLRIAYDLYFDEEDIDEKTLMDIAKSFMITPPHM